MKKANKVLAVINIGVILFFISSLYVESFPALIATAADIIYPSQNKDTAHKEGSQLTVVTNKDAVPAKPAEKAKQKDDTLVELDGMEVLLNDSGEVIGWKRKENLEDIPVQLPSRNVKTDDKGNTVIEVDDPDSIIFDQKLFEIEKLPEIRPVDEAAIKIAQAYSSAQTAPKPFMGENNGRINFYYGTMNPRIICRPLRLTDIELEPGEQVRSVHISDTARWQVSGAWSGDATNQVSHVILKPQLPDIAASLLIHTDRRTYALELISTTKEEYMPLIGFLYPESMQQATSASDNASWNELMKQYDLANKAQEKAQHEKEITEQDARLTDPSMIFTDYTIKVIKGKNIAWKPKSVFDANGKTYVVMPEKMQLTEAPIFFIKTNGREKMTNYRVERNLYVIDRLFDIGILTIGKDRVALYRNRPVGAPDHEYLPLPVAPVPTPTQRRMSDDITSQIDEIVTRTPDTTAVVTPKQTGSAAKVTAPVNNTAATSGESKPQSRDYEKDYNMLLKKYELEKKGEK